jgi:diguanylate cyclase (GGDEF)-like protein
MTDGKSVLERRLAGLRASFLDRVATQLEQAGHLIAALAETAAPLADLRLLMHTIKGSAATFGGKELSRTAEEAEVLLAELPAVGCAPPLVVAQLTDCLTTMKAALRTLASQEWSAGPLAAAPIASTADQPDEEARKLVYLCEDDTWLADQLRHQLGCFGYELWPYETTEALRVAVAHRTPDVVIMDVMLPEGEDAAFATVRDLNTGGNTVPAVFLSARHDFATRLRAVRAGGEGYVGKPASLVTLVEHLDQITGRSLVEACRVLVIDDEPEVATYHAMILERAGMIVRTTDDPLAVLDVLEEFRPDLVLMDMYMPACSGRELAAVIRQMPRFLSMPIVYLSSETDAGKQTIALGAGADGFLVKPIEPAQLIAQVAFRAERMRGLRALMVRDSLTGLLNHNAVKQFLDKEVASAGRNDERICFAMIDVDHFKAVNDTYGHPVGDQVLMALSRLLRQQLRSSDVVGRYGGEEFAVILTNVGIEDGVRTIDGLRESFAKLRFQAGAAEFSATFSCGVADFPRFATSQCLCEAADRALYHGKRLGRNRVVAAIAE